MKIYPHKVVEANATVTSSIIWETRGAFSIFSGVGVSGLANIDLSPEFATRVAMAYATMLPKGATVTTSRDSSRSARMLKRAVMVGLTAAGLNVEDLELADGAGDSLPRANRPEPRRRVGSTRRGRSEHRRDPLP